ncbi:error-prone DNA polymerase [Haloferula sargassicola]|uniref:Error-prone DNA polymerase n=1 Tax=Haloferula sargassicola TaxID=490096 RepID=A0ABP9UP88_9BACT
MPAELHARSAFSFLRGASQPEAMVHRAAELGLRSIALADHDGFYGSARAHQAALDCGIRAIPAATLDIAGAPVPVLCANHEGYRTLCRHLTNGHLGTIVRHTPLNGGGLIALTGDREGPVMRNLIKDDRDAALRAAESLIDLFGAGNVYVEIMRHGLRDDGRLIRHLTDLAAHLKLPLLATNAPLHATRADRLLADAFTCLRHHIPLDQAGRLLAPNGERHLKSPKDLARLFADQPQALTNVRQLDERLQFTLANLGYRFPDFPDESGKPMTLPDQTRLLRQRSLEGARERYGKPSSEVFAQIDKEIELIDRLGFSGYFLIVQDIVRFARSRGILCQGRGSAANSVVCFVLGITNVDAFKQRLVFERFLSENQRKWPDIDIDFPSGERRESVIQYVFQKYGARGAAMTANVITYRPRSAFREMSKVLGFPPSLADRFSTTGHHSHHDEHEEEGADFHRLVPPSHPRAAALEKLYHAVLGMPRHLGQHSGGMIICHRGLDEVVPIEPATMPGRTIVQWDKDDCEDLGIVKIDLLGLGMLAAMQDAFSICEKRGHLVDPARIPLGDPKVYEMLHRADTVGTFQVESRAQMSTLRILRPNHFYEVAIQVAIVRPGPIVGDLLHPYLRRRNGLEPPDFIHPDFKPVLERTLGVPLFQEQVLKMAMLIAGFSGGEADDLRRAMAFNRTDERMKKVTAKLRQRMSERGVDAEVQEKVVHSIGNFALYGFPESHALAFALIAYHSCWLKVHHPAEFYTGLINNQPMGFYSAHSLLQDAKRHGLRALPVSCVHSSWETEVIDDQTIRLGLHRLKGLSRETADRLLAERVRRPFAALDDFLTRAAPNARERRLLAKAGTLNDLPEALHRREALWQVELPLHDDLLNPTTPPPAARSSPFRGSPSPGSPLPPMSMPERLAADLSTQGLSTGPHPMKLWRRSSTMPLVEARTLQTLPHGKVIEIGGLVICRQRPGTAKGHCFISLEDETGIANLFVPKKTFHELRLTIVSEPFLWATGHVQISEGDQRTVYVTDLKPLPQADSRHIASSHDFH